MDATPTERFARCIAASKRVRWEVESDVIRGRRFDVATKFLPDGLTLAGTLPFLAPDEKRYFSQVQGRTYANMFGLVERFINAKVLELSRDHWFGDQTALEALIRFSDEELKHQALFRRVEALISEAMPAGYSFSWNPNDVAGVVLGKSSWAVLALTLHIELFTQAHYRESIRHDAYASAELRGLTYADATPDELLKQPRDPLLGPMGFKALLRAKRHAEAIDWLVTSFDRLTPEAAVDLLAAWLANPPPPAPTAPPKRAG